MSRGTAALTIGAVLTVATTAAIWWLRADAAGVQPRDDGAQRTPSPAPATTGAAIDPATGTVAPAAEDRPPILIDPPLPADRTWLLPDGTRVTALNGAVGARPLSEAWPRDVPWSPIVRIERSDLGVDWYVHEDGRRSTTEMKWRSDLGREDAVTRLGQPTPTAPKPMAPKPMAPR